MRALLLAAALMVAVPAVAAPPLPDDQVTPEMLVSKLTRGIRAAAAPDLAHHETAAAPAPAAEPTGPSVDLNIRFTTGSADLDPAGLSVLKALGKALTNPALRADKFLIEGHTDTVGNAAANRDLSERRARRVAAYLIEHYDVAPQRLTTRGLGEEGLAVATPAQTDEPRNRRVHIVNLGA